MMTVRPAEDLGSVLAGRGDGTILRARVERLATESPVIVDFAGVVSASPSFADEFFAKLDRALLDDGRITFTNVPPSVTAIARYVLASRGTSLPAS